jgi:hypothetical protein
MASSAKRTEYMRDYMRAYRAEGRDPSRSSASAVSGSFVGVDGEGGNLENGYHAYFLLRAGESYVVPREGNKRLTSRECLGFLADLPPDNIYVAYFFDYDVTKILEDVAWSKLDELTNRGKRKRDFRGKPYAVAWGGFEFDYLPRKEFKVRRWLPDGSRTRWVVINDVGSFFQCRFVEALDKWNIGTLKQRESIGVGKDKRANFTIDDLEEIDPYNQLEIVLLQELMGKFRDACQEVGIIPSKWQGPGQLAEAAFRKFGVKRSRDVPLFDPNDDTYTSLLNFARSAFYGGRPELSCVGPVERPLYQWDINSAYPRAMLDLPCVEHGTWENIRADHDKLSAHGVLRGLRKGKDYALLYGSFTAPPSLPGRKRPLWFGLPVRDDQGSIRYPASGRGWYWSFEVEASIHQDFSVEEAWIYTSTCDCQPLGFVKDLYEERLRLGKDGAGMVLKLALNSLYGKTVQSVGFPKYSNPIWGSFITAHCRTTIQQFIHSSPKCAAGECGVDILMIATDSCVTWSVRDDIEPSDKLGGWSVEEHPEGMFLIQPGLYFGTSTKQKDKPKTRGVPRSAIETMEQDFRNAFNKMANSQCFEDGDVIVPQRMFVGIRYALHRRNAKLLGQWIEFSDPETGVTGKVIRFDWTTKRARFPVHQPLPGIRTYISTYPQEGSADICTVPYSKDIGGMLKAALEEIRMEATPDWGQELGPGEMIHA